MLTHSAVLVEPGRFGQLLISCVKLFKVNGSCWWKSDVGDTVDEYFKWFNGFERVGEGREERLSSTTSSHFSIAHTCKEKFKKIFLLFIKFDWQGMD